MMNIDLPFPSIELKSTLDFIDGLTFTPNPHPKDLSKSPTFVGFFASRHLGLSVLTLTLMEDALWLI